MTDDPRGIRSAYAAADPLPQEVREALKDAVKRGLVPFTVDDVEEARFLKADSAIARPIFPGGDVIAITYYNLVIVTDKFLGNTPCGVLSSCTHELTHVRQYKRNGWDWFLNTYLAQGLVEDWADIRYEREANGAEIRVSRDCVAGLRRFRRGDANDDGKLDISDAIEVLKVLFLGGTFGCRDAADFDDNGRIELTDAVAGLQHLFLDGLPPKLPGHRCGSDPTLDNLGCESSQSCMRFPVGS